MGGRVTAVGEVRPYTRTDGQAAASVDVFLQASDPRFASDRISMPPELAPQVGDDVFYDAVCRPKNGQFGPWLSVWCTARLDVTVTVHEAKPAVAAVK